MTRANAYVLFDAENPDEKGFIPDAEEFYHKHKDEFGPFVDAWVFAPGSDEAVVTGFFRRSRDTPFDPSSGELPYLSKAGLVLIDERGDQMWLTHAGTSGAGGRGVAIRILNDAGFNMGPDGLGLDTHFVDRKWAHDPFHPREKNRLLNLEGQVSISANGSAVKCIAAEKTENQSALFKWWYSAIGPGTWLEDVTSLNLYLNPRISEIHGHYGYQLIAVGSTGREAWIHLPMPVISDSMTPEHQRQQVRRFAPIQISLDRAVEQIFGSADFDINLTDERFWLLRRLSPRERPDIIERRK